ncbi:MAG: recombinase family protein [Clostridia bacterium]|nr:recombinase family protein [Clostridia bacterium]
MAERVYCLYRVSTTKQVDINEQNQADIPMQRKACHEFANRMGWTIVREEQENGISGFKVHAADRDKIQLIKEHARDEKFDILLVFMFDRIGRIAAETPFVVEELVQSGIRVWSVNEGEQRFDSHTDFLTNYIRFWQADGESKKTSIRTKTALGQMVQEGRFRGGKAPFGYRLEKSGVINKRKHEVYKLVIDEEEAKVVRRMFDLVVASGFGRWRLAMFLNEKGILNRDGRNWHDATVGAILHNVIYKGILRSGETYSEPFEEFQIIDPYTFDRAQEIMRDRIKESKETRTTPLNTSGQSLLSGNVFCGHCGGRLVLTTNGKVVRLANGEIKGVKRIRYVCYNKTRRRLACDGQTGYTMRILDDAVTEVLHQIFNRMSAVTDEIIINSVQERNMAKLRADVKRVKAENSKANTEYESLKAEVVKAVQGKSKMPMEVLSELVDESRDKVLVTSERLSTLMAELDHGNEKETEMKAELDRIRSWAEIFDSSEMDVKKMIANYIIKRVNVYEGYELDIVLNMNVQQYLTGLDQIVEETAS